MQAHIFTMGKSGVSDTGFADEMIILATFYAVKVLRSKTMQTILFLSLNPVLKIFVNIYKGTSLQNLKIINSC